jgi:predicted ATPase
LRRCAQFRQRYDAERHRRLTDLYSTDLELVCVVHEAIGLWITGDTDRATDTARRARALAVAGQHPYSIAWSHTWAGVVDLLIGDTDALAPALQIGRDIALEHGYAYVVAMGRTLEGWLEGDRDEPGRGADLMRAGLIDFRATGAEIAGPFFETLAAELLVRSGRPTEALASLARAMTQIEAWGERWTEAEAYRLQGNALVAIAGGCTAEAEASYQRAIEISHRQGGRGWQLRATCDYAAALQHAGRDAEARELLAPLLASFDGMRVTQDVARAQVILAR